MFTHKDDTGASVDFKEKNKQQGRKPRAFKTGADCKRQTGAHGKKPLADETVL